jgi:hypothetical protein
MPGPIRRGPDRRQLIDRLRQHLLPQVLPIPPKQMAQVEYWPWRQRTGGRAPAYILTSPAVAGIKCSDDTGSLPPSRPRSQRRGNPVWSRTLLEERGRKRGGPACPHPPWRFPAFDQGHGNRFFRSIFARQAMSELLVQPRTWLAQHGCHLGAYGVAVRGLAHIPSLARVQDLLCCRNGASVQGHFSQRKTALPRLQRSCRSERPPLPSSPNPSLQA